MDSRLAPSPVDTAALLGLDHNGIHWTDVTRNVGEGCERISPACENCWAEGVAATRLAHIPGIVGDRYRAVTNGKGWNRRVIADPARIPGAFKGLRRTVKGAGGVPRVPRVWLGSMWDLFHKDVPFSFIDAVFVEMAARPQVFQVLTKRAERMAAYARQRALPWPANIWAGVTVEDQRRADERIPHLLRVPAAVRFLSVEPCLSGIDLMPYLFASGDDGEPAPRNELPCLHWVIVGSESDGPRPGARETREEWITGIVDQCDAAGVAVFVKQAAIGGKLCALPLVDGKVRAEFPEVAP